MRNISNNNDFFLIKTKNNETLKFELFYLFYSNPVYLPIEMISVLE